MAVIRGPRDGISCVASGDLSGLQFKFVSKATDPQGKVVMIPSSGAQSEGVLQNKPRNSEHAAVVNQGNTKLYLASSLGGGAEVACGSGGWAVTATGSGQFKMGYLITGADSGLIAEAFINPYRSSAT
jgi:hypothetical protein